MRVRERIPKFIDRINEQFIHEVFLSLFKTNFEESELKVVKSKRKIKKYWMANHDLRFTQVLVNMGFVENFPGFWYYIEDEGILLSVGVPAREVFYWGQNYDKDMNKLEQTNWILIKDMSTDHIETIIDGGWVREDSAYKRYFEEELMFRGTQASI